MLPFDAAAAYLNLLKKALRNRLLADPGDVGFTSTELKRADRAIARVRRRFARAIGQLEAPQREGRTPEQQASLQALLRDFGRQDVARFLRINSPQAHTLLDEAALDHLQACAHQICMFDIPGDFMECGVWRGGACIFLRALQRAFGAGGRRVWVADSFQGLPAPDPDKNLLDAVLHEYLQDAGGFRVTLEEVRQNFARYDLLDDQVRFLPGWFHETLPSFQGQLALLRLDGDWYESTRVALESLYDWISEGGYIVIDDYHPVVGAYAAVNDFRRERGVTDPITSVNHQLHFWRKL